MEGRSEREGKSGEQGLDLGSQDTLWRGGRNRKESLGSRLVGEDTVGEDTSRLVGEDTSLSLRRSRQHSWTWSVERRKD